MKVIYNGRIITLNETQPFLENGAIAIDNGNIVDVGSSFEILGKYKDAELIDADQSLIIPGFINTICISIVLLQEVLDLVVQVRPILKKS